MSESSDVRDNTSASRYELAIGDSLAHLDYADRDHGRRRILVHTEVPPELGGRGAGTRLVKAALDDARTHGRRVVAMCPFVRSYIEKHGEYADLLEPNVPDA
jgi:hypothetical protein